MSIIKPEVNKSFFFFFSVGTLLSYHLESDGNKDLMLSQLVFIEEVC